MKRKFSVFLLSTLVIWLTIGGTSSLAAAQESKENKTAVISGKVKDLNENGVGGAIVTVEGQKAKATTAADGSFKLTSVIPGAVFLYAETPSDANLDGEILKAITAKAGTTVSGVEITLSGRPGASATYVGINSCTGCHDDLAKSFDGSPNAAAHSRFITEGTSNLVYKNLWPEPGDKLLPRNPKGELLKAQDPLDGTGMVNFVLCTKGDEPQREYLFKFYPEQKEGVTLGEKALDCSDSPANAVWIPIAATNGGQGNWGKGYVDPEHKMPDRHPNYGEGKQRYMAKVQDVPYLVQWMKDNNVNRDGQKQDYVAYMPYFLMQDGTPTGSDVLAEGEIGFPNFWQKSPDHWCTPDNTLSRNCSGCHATGVKIETRDFMDDPDPHHQYKSVVVDWDYKDLNITCERCHGPGSEHAASGDVTKIIAPQHLTAQAGGELCGQCHGNHDGKSITPAGIYKPTYNAANKDRIGYGYFVPGIYQLKDYVANFGKTTTSLKPDWKEGSFHTWPDQVHQRSHSTELLEFRASAHADNSQQKLTCFSCHDAHSLDGGPASLKVAEYNFGNATYGNNTLCLTCHASTGDFAEITLADVAALQLKAGRKVTVNGADFTVSEQDVALARNRVARSVGKHMQVGAGMGGALYTPDNPDMPVGSCTSCHMAKIGKLQDINVDSMWKLAIDSSGKSAVAEGNVPSHVFDIVWPGQSSVLKNPDPSKGKDYDIMPNSCSNCHAFARISGDLD